MKKIFISLFAFLLLLVARGQTKNFIDLPYLETQVRNDTLVTPDQIYLSIEISELDQKNRVSLEVLEEKLFQTLDQLDIDLENQLKLSDLESDFRSYFLRKKGIVKRKLFTLLVYDAASAGSVIYYLEREGISNITLKKTRYSKSESLQLHLKSEAMKQAKRQGKAMADAVGQKLGKAIHVVDHYYNLIPPAKLNVRALSIITEDGEQKQNRTFPIAFEKIRFQVELSVKFELQ
ncbi:MAG: SIMPL domain-containing protein [Flavobacteriaceae bacterium]